MRDLIGKFLNERGISCFEGLRQWGYEPAPRQRRDITQHVTRARNPLTFHEAFTSGFVGDKFGEATTHWRKLVDRVRRGVGNPCPLLLIGLPPSIITSHEGKAALAEAEAAEDQ